MTRHRGTPSTQDWKYLLLAGILLLALVGIVIIVSTAPSTAP